MGQYDYAYVTITPGELLKEEFLEPLGISQYRLAKEIGVPAGRIGQIVAGKRAITADTDLRLCRFFGLSNCVLRQHTIPRSPNTSLLTSSRKSRHFTALRK